MESLFVEQTDLVDSMKQLLANFKKDGPSRRTREYLDKRIKMLDSYWQQFQGNHIKLCEYSDKSYEYFESGEYERTRAFYIDAKNYISSFIVTEKEGPSGAPGPANTLVTQDVTPQTPAGGAHTRQDVPFMPRHVGVNSKSDDLLKKQLSNFRAFERTVMNINLNALGEKWELEDTLRSLQQRWSAIDALHWEIDSETEGSNIAYETMFTNHERTFNNMKKVLNSNLGSVSMREKATPQIDIPMFEGNYHQWVSFKDLFQEVIHNNNSLSNAQKLQFLKSKLSGEAERLVHHVPISSENYQACWEILNNRFNNKKLIFTSHINILLGLPVGHQVSMNHIKSVHDTTIECLNSIKNLGVDITSWDPLLVHLITRKLDGDTYNDYIESLKQPRDLPVLQELLSFLEAKFTAMESANRKPVNSQQRNYENNPRSSNNSSYSGFNKNVPYKSTKHSFQNQVAQLSKQDNVSNSKKYKCAICKVNNHGLYFCEKFINMTPESKLKTIKCNNICINCLYYHGNKACSSEKRCRVCNALHNSILHDAFVQPNSACASTSCDRATTSKSSANCTVQDQQNHTKTSTHVVSQQGISEILLATAMIKVEGADGNMHDMRVLIDQGSQSSLITTSAAKRLSLPRQRCSGVITGVGSKEVGCKALLTIKCKSHYNDFEFYTDVFVMDTLMRNLPSYTFDKPAWAHIDNIQLADPSFYVTRPIDILLGADVYAHILLEGICRSSDDTLPIAQQTRLGWILSGNTRVVNIQCNVILNDIDEIRRFWESEDISKRDTIEDQEDQCVQFYEKTTIRLEDGRYQVRLPLKQGYEQNLGQSKATAVAQFRSLEKKLQKDNATSIKYKEFIKEYISLGHMKPSVGNMKPDYYMPHHGVCRAESTTTSLRVVFNASSKSTSGYSLNELMEGGPNLQQDLQLLLLKWRQYKIVFTADIKKFFRQIWVHPEDQKLQKIVWRNSPDDLIQDYQLLTVTYGTKAAPFLCMMTLRKLAQDERENYPHSKALQVIKEAFYTDDLLYGCHDTNSALTLQRDLINILRSAGLILRKWKSNTDILLKEVDKDELCTENMEFKQENSTKTLGLIWNPTHDLFTFRSNLERDIKKHTKRSLSSEISKIFDPLGWLTPLTTKLKIIFQSAWEAKLAWDDTLPENILTEWLQVRSEIHNINQITIPRWFQITDKDIVELHGFCDASFKAYSCVIYCVVTREDKKLITLATAKAKIVSIHSKMTIPRLELCGAVLLARLMNKLKTCLEEYDIKVHAWTDSTAVLGWIQGDVARWKPFVANRVRQIKESIPEASWQYVKTTDNPADSASRGITVKNLINNTLWWHGPTWLSSDHQIETILYHTDQEVKIKHQQVCLTQQGDTTHNIIYDLLYRHSDYNKIVRILAWVLRVTSKNRKQQAYLTVEEIQSARTLIIKYVQRESYKEEICDLLKNQAVNSKSKIFNLLPFIDQHGLLRVGGRLANANIDFNMKHPMIIPYNTRLTELLIDDTHKRTHHGGPRLVLAQIRQNYWVTSGNRAVKKRLRQCIKCRRFATSKNHQLMGELPSARCNISRPFYHTGVDFTGFYEVKANKGRGIRTTRAYIAVFVCMATKAIHLELVSDLSTSAFLAALKRMTARRGVPNSIYSDNGTNFVGANRILQEGIQHLEQIFNDDFNKEITDMNIKWYFNAPSWPSAGGLWEAAVKSLKFHLKRVVGEQKLTFEEFTTILAQLEACLNSRPLLPLSDEADGGLNCLTPSHFLASGPTLTLVETEQDLRTRWHLTQKIVQDVWKRWQTEYLVQLSSRSKWNKPQSNMKIDDIVLIHDSNLPPGRWAMGRVIELHPGADGLVRVVSLRTKNKILKRPITKLSLLPVSNEEDKQVSNNIPTCTNVVNQRVHTIQQGSAKTRFSFMSLITLYLMIISIFSPSLAAYNKTQLRDNQGLFFDKKSHLKLIRDEWTIITYYELDPYWKGIETLKKYTTHLSSVCEGDKRHAQCHIILLQLQHELSELEYYNQLLLNQHNSASRELRLRRRRRRGLINGVGYVAHSLFGVLDERFARQYQRDISTIKYNQRHLERLSINQTSLIETEFNVLKRTQDAIEKQHKLINKHFEQINSNFMNANKSIQELYNSNEFSLLAITASNLAHSLKQLQNSLIDTIIDIYHERFNYHLITPNQFREELNKISGRLPIDLALPIDNIQQELTRLYRLLKIRVRMLYEHLIFEIRMPLIARDSYELFELIPIPKQEGDKVTSIVPVSNYVAVNLKKSSYLPLTELELHTCILLDGEMFYCHFNTPIYQMTQDSDLCKKRKALASVNKENCETVSNYCINIWHQLTNLNTYFYFCCHQCNFRVMCEDQVEAGQLTSAGIIIISPNCQIKLEDFTVYARKHEQSLWNIQADLEVPQFASINHVFNLAISSYNDTTDIGKMENQSSLMTKLEHGIDDLKQEPGLIEDVSYHDVHHYTMIYLILGLAVVCALAYWYRQCTRRRRQAAGQVGGTPPAAAAAGVHRAPYPTRNPIRQKRNSDSVSVVSVNSSENNGQLSECAGSKRYRDRKVNKGTSPMFRKPVLPITEEYI